MRYATIGAGPINGLLIGGINRERDVSEECHNIVVLELPSEYKDEDELINKLFELVVNYNNNVVPYTLFPAANSSEYNSNSFISGIGQAGGLTMPLRTGARTPGYGNPVPLNNFNSAE